MDAFITINRENCRGFLANNAFVGGGLTPRIISGPGRVTGPIDIGAFEYVQ